MTESEHLLICLAEECAEVSEACARVVVRVSKALRFGLHEIEPGKDADNARRIVGELADLLAVADMLRERGLIPKARLVSKQEKLLAFMEYSRRCGVLSPEEP